MKKRFWQNKLFMLILAFVFISLTLISCGSAHGDTSHESSAQQSTVGTEALDYSELPYTDTPGALSVLGTPITKYRIVIPENCDNYTLYAAKLFSEYLYSNANISLDTVTDNETPYEFEFIFGKANRNGSISARKIPLEKDEYVFFKDGSAVIFYGDSYMVGGGAGVFLTELAAGVWRGYDIDIDNIPDQPCPTEFNFSEPNNAILLIGDGMGKNHVDFAFSGENTHFSGYDMPVIGSLVTRSLSGTTDSAAGGTALSCGFKTVNGYIGVNALKQPLKNIRELAHESGAKTAVLSTDTITGATPSAFLSHIADRNDTDFLNESLSDLISREMVEIAIGSLDNTSFFSTSTDTLSDISKKGSRFFLVIEEGYIDKYSHMNAAPDMIHTVKRLNNIVAYCIEFVLFHPDTVLIVTADHETGGLELSKESEQAHEYKFATTGHTNVNVPIYALGSGTEYFDGVTHDNTRVATFIAAIFSQSPFGDHAYN